MSLSESVQSKVEELAAEVCEREGLSLYDVEYLQSLKVVRIFIDTDDEGGITVDNCVTVSNGVNLLLDIEDPVSGAYNLEVSSPGLERHLRHKWHYDAQIDSPIKAILKARTDTTKKLGTKQVEGTLKSTLEDGFILVMNSEKEVEIPFQDVHKCNLVFEF